MSERETFCGWQTHPATRVDQASYCETETYGLPYCAPHQATSDALEELERSMPDDIPDWEPGHYPDLQSKATGHDFIVIDDCYRCANCEALIGKPGPCR